MTRRSSAPRRPVIPLLALILATFVVSVPGQTGPGILPELDPNLPPTAPENLPRLYERLVAAFDDEYGAHLETQRHRDLSDGMTVYYLRQELQALIDIWRATGNDAYLDQATDLALQAIQAAAGNLQPLLWHGEWRGNWPCFFLESVQAQTGGHNQLCDFQGCAGFLHVARVLQEVNRPEWKPITDFVEHQVVTKWLYYKPSITGWDLTVDPDSANTLFAILNAGRDVREQFACICLDLYALGRRNYAYDRWAGRLIEMYLTPRYDVNQPAPHQDEMPRLIPANWGLFARSTSDGWTWFVVPNDDPARWSEPADTSHANRAAWLAARAYAEGLIDPNVIGGLVNTLRDRIWTPANGPFYFTNYTDGSDDEINGLPAGRGGNVWFGWHRLAAHDESLRTLFLSLACDLTYDGPNLPTGAQNKSMLNARTCLEAWAARLIAEEGRPKIFP